MARTDRSLRLSKQRGFYRGQFDAMGGLCELLVDADDGDFAEKLLNIASAEAWRIEDKFSRYLPGNIVAKINQSEGATVRVDGETANLLDFAQTLYELSDRRFDITSGVLRRVWTFDGSDRLPSADDVEQVRSSVGWEKTSWNRPAIKLQDGMQIDLGGIGKEYAVDKAAGLVARDGDHCCLLNFGGDLVATGRARQPDGWQVGIESVNDNGVLAEKIIQLKTGALATSGDARRFLLRDGRRYGHVLDPLTGWPIENAPRSVTVAADTCTQAGMLATIAMLKGTGAEEFLEQQNAKFWCIR